MRSAPPQRMLLATALSVIGLVMAVGPAMAHTASDGDWHRGKVGRHHFVDTKDRPGARCVYADVAPTVDAIKVELVDAVFAGVVVRPPKMAALDRTDHVDFGVVGWRFILEEKVGAGDWTKVKRSAIQIRRTSDRRAARFSRLGVRYDGDPEAMYRVTVKALWFGRHRHVIGVAGHIVDFYRIPGDVVEGSCPGGIATV